MNGYEKRSNQKKQAILDSAQELFFKRGVVDAAIAEIAAKAHVSQVSIYNYFGSKENLLREVMQRFMNKTMEEAESFLESDMPFKEKFEKMLLRGEEKENAVSDSFFNTVVWDDPQLQAVYRESVVKIFPFFQKLIKQGQEAGEIHKSITPEALVAYVSAFMPIMTHPDFLKSSREYKNAISRLFFYGIVGK